MLTGLRSDLYTFWAPALRCNRRVLAPPRGRSSKEAYIVQRSVATLGVVEVGNMGEVAQPTVARKLGGKSLLEWVTRRLTDCTRLDAVVVLVTDATSQRIVRSLAPGDVPLLIGKQPDPLARLAFAAAHYDAAAIVCVPASSPFLDPVLIDRLVRTADEHSACEYIGYCHSDGRPAIQSRLGVAAEWGSAAALRRADELARGPERQAGLRYLAAHPELFAVRLVPVPQPLDRDDVRLAVRDDEDWEHAMAIYEALGPEECDWRRIAGLLDGQPAMRERMAALNRRV